MTNCVFLDKLAFHINLKRGMAWSKKGTTVIVTLHTAKANTMLILGLISATALINVSLRAPKRIKKINVNDRISEACDSLYLCYLKSFVSHSAKRFGKCLNKEKL